MCIKVEERLWEEEPSFLNTNLRNHFGWWDIKTPVSNENLARLGYISNLCWKGKVEVNMLELGISCLKVRS